MTEEKKKAVIQALLEELETQRFTNETMGQAWQTVGNAQAAEACAKKVSEFLQMEKALKDKLTQ